MSYAIICSSKTGNTEKLAQRAREILGEEDEGPVADADLVLVGSWTDKGGMDPALAEALPPLAGKRVFLFGTCGFGGSQAYYDRVLDRFQSALPEGAQVVGRFMCQGQMPPAVRERYVKMAEQDPKRFEPMIENFDRALGHPDAADLTAFENALRSAL
ncbi:hypothetical protein INF26_07355 [Olsenella sp. DSM 107455]|uniref:Flavodoxin-like domain-containing protein n=1 Tax=Thermophilibacter gallinarum TaxID=2779357 RepID=A0ABR9QUA4_9ACTN|nr:flavodoxin family protein BilS [Thermophilibacter gallinarum]MBE5024666.1 hypothetical protein [Thermophilibacter gallinarum]